MSVTLGIFQVRKPVWIFWTMIVAGAALGAAALTTYENRAPNPPDRIAAAPALGPGPGSPTWPAPAPAAPQASAPAERPSRPMLQPEATGSIAQPGLTPADRERPPALAAVAPDGPYRLSLRRNAGALVLTGFLPDAAAREQLAGLARERFFHERIVDETRLAGGAPPQFLSAARFALDQLSQLASGEAVIAGASLRLQGEALYAQLAEEIEGKVARKGPAGYKGSADIRTRDTEAGESQ